MNSFLIFVFGTFVSIAHSNKSASSLFTIYRTDNELKELVGSIHHVCNDGQFGSSNVNAAIKVFGFKDSISSGILDEITLWNQVQFVDISTEILFEPNDKPVDERLKLEDLNPRFLKLAMFEYMFINEVRNEDRVLFVENGYLFEKELLDLKEDGKGIGFEILSKLTLDRELGSMRLLKMNNDASNVAYLDYSEKIKLPLVDEKSKWKCSIRVRQELVFSKMIKQQKIPKVSLGSPEVSKKVTGTRVALLVPAKNPETTTDINETPLVKMFISSLNEFSDDLDVKIFVGYDSGDILGLKSNQNQIRGLVPKIEIEFVEFPRTNWVTFIWNSLYAMAMQENFDYFVQVNDDVTFKANDWVDTSIVKLIENPNSAVVGLYDSFFKCTLFTQSMANRKHYEYFSGHFFPLTFKNWFSDKWITHIYGNNSICNPKALIRNGKGDAPRYTPCGNEAKYKNVLSAGKIILQVAQNIKNQ